MLSNSSRMSRREILELPYNEFIPGRRWIPQPPTEQPERPALIWKTVLVPQQLEQITSHEEYYFLLVRRVEWLIQQDIEYFRRTYEEQEEKEVEQWIASQINEYLPIYVNYLHRHCSPRQMAEGVVMNYQELQMQCFPMWWEQEFPVTPYPELETDLKLWMDMNLTDWLMWMNMEANPHYFQD